MCVYAKKSKGVHPPPLKMGRNRLSVEQKKLSGTYQASRDIEPQAVTPLTRMPTIPEWICDEGKRIWREEGPNLLRTGILTASDIGSFSRYCQFSGLFEKLMAQLVGQELVVTMPNGVEGPNPTFKMAIDCQNQADKLGRQFGLSPSTRKNVPLPKAAEPEDEFDRIYRLVA